MGESEQGASYWYGEVLVLYFLTLENILLFFFYIRKTKVGSYKAYESYTFAMQFSSLRTKYRFKNIYLHSVL